MQSHTPTETARAILRRCDDKRTVKTYRPKLPRLVPVECRTCEGKGRVEYIAGGWDEPDWQWRTCPDCDGDGVEKCQVCCRDTAAMLIDYDDASRLTPVCEDCQIDGQTDVVAHALAVLP